MHYNFSYDLLIIITHALYAHTAGGYKCNSCNDGDVRLVNGTTELEGRIELCLANTWGNVCDDHWGDADATVVCRQLGFSDNGIVIKMGLLHFENAIIITNHTFDCYV